MLTSFYLINHPHLFYRIRSAFDTTLLPLSAWHNPIYFCQSVLVGKTSKNLCYPANFPHFEAFQTCSQNTLKMLNVGWKCCWVSQCERWRWVSGVSLTTSVQRRIQREQFRQEEGVVWFRSSSWIRSPGPVFLPTPPWLSEPGWWLGCCHSDRL